MGKRRSTAFCFTKRGVQREAVSRRQWRDFQLGFRFGRFTGTLLFADLAADAREGLANIGLHAGRVMKRAVENGFHVAF
jgi:hypothetical protein